MMDSYGWGSQLRRRRQMGAAPWCWELDDNRNALIQAITQAQAVGVDSGTIASAQATLDSVSGTFGLGDSWLLAGDACSKAITEVQGQITNLNAAIQTAGTTPAAPQPQNLPQHTSALASLMPSIPGWVVPTVLIVLGLGATAWLASSVAKIWTHKRKG